MKRDLLLRAASIGAVAAVVVGLVAPVAHAGGPKKPPTPVITSAPSAFTNQTSATITFTSASTTALTYCSRDGAKATACTSPVTYTGLAAGSHTFAVYAKAGKFKSGTAMRTWTVDLTPPAPPSTSQPTSPTKLTTYSISFSSSSPDVASYRCSLDSAPLAPCTSPVSGSGLSSGFHRLTVLAVDQAGNQSAPRTVTWTVDSSTPVPTITSGPPSVTNSTNATFTFASTEAGVTFTCARDTNTFTACVSPKAYTGLINATHDFRVRATDAAGNVATSATYTWTVQAAAVPALAWSNPAGLPAGVSNQTSATFAFSTTGTTSLACVLDGVTQATCASPSAFAGLGDGDHVFTLLADSGLGSQTSLTYRWDVDTVAPMAPTIEAPSGTVASADAVIIVTPGAIDDVLSCTLDASPVACATAFTATGLADGSHTIHATASDTASNSANSTASWVVDTTAPTATVDAPATVTAPVVVSFDEPVTGVSPRSIQLTNEAGAPLATAQTCRDGAAATSCTGGSVTEVRLTPKTPLVPGEHYAAAVNTVEVTVADAVGNLATATTEAFRGALDVAETSPALTWTWRTVKTKQAKGGSYLTESRKGARVSWTFSGRSVAWITAVGPTQGKATVLIDGKAKASVNNYARTARYGVARVVKGLPKAIHTVTLVATGKKGAKAGKGSFVVVDAFKVGKKLTSTPVVTAAWQRAKSASAAGGGYALAGLKGQSVKLTFRGTGITWLTATGPKFGKASLSVDGVKVGTFDNYAAASTWQVERAVTGLTDGRHTVVVKVLGSKNTKAAAADVVVDGFTVA
ncbi:MAG: hypothetical protein OEV62_03270 [Actinomycetota bacterium]|nr:hypothetical protein [Actinomycetota bacterium]